MPRTAVPTLVLALLFVAPAFGQTSYPSEAGAPPADAGVFRMSAGALLADDPTGRAGPATVFENPLASDRYFVPGANEEWVESGTLLPRSADLGEQVNAIEFSYCSTEPDATGNSGSFTIRLYDDWVDGVGPAAGARRSSYDLTGLPLGGPGGELRCWTVQVNLQGGFECTTDLDAKFRTEAGVGRRFGVGLIAHDPNTGPMLAEGGFGSVDHLDALDATTGAFLDQYWFDGAPHAGLAVKLLGNDPGAFRYFPDQPGPRDTVQLHSSTVVPGQVAIWWIEPYNPNRHYTLYTALNPADWGFGGMTALLDRNAENPKPMPGGQLTFFVPASTPPQFLVQAVESTTNQADPQDFRAMSFGIQHVIR